MTYQEIYEQFLSTTNIDKNMIADYRPALAPYTPLLKAEMCLNTFEGIVVFLKDGNKLIYVSDVEVKGYAYFKDESKEREVITNYTIINDEHIRFTTKSGEYVYYTEIRTRHDRDQPIVKYKSYDFLKVKKIYDGVGDIVEIDLMPCDIEMVHLLKENETLMIGAKPI
jgi:hypothetical protein